MNIDEIKKLQSKIIKKNKICDIISTIVILIIIFFSIFFFFSFKSAFSNKMYYLYIIVIFIFELVFFEMIISFVKELINSKDIKLFNKNYKNTFVLSALKNNFDEVDYDYRKGFTADYVRSLEMLNIGDRYSSNDFISGKYKDIKFEQSDIHIEKEHETEDSNGNVSINWETIFRGRLMIFDFNKSFKTNIRVISSNFKGSSLPINKKFIEVILEDLEFNKIFHVYAQNEHEVFYILTPHFMEKIKELIMKLKCETMFCFADNRLYVAVNNHNDSFEYNVFKTINEKDVEENIMMDIKLITDFVNELNLDNKVFGERV